MGRKLFGESAIGRIPVVSASGEPLMPCKPSKALSLLKSGKAVVKWIENGGFYLQLTFDPKSPIVHPAEDFMENVMKPSGGECRGIWSVVQPTRSFIEGLWEIAQTKESCLRSLSEADKAFMKVLLKARWRKIEDPTILEAVTPIVKTILDAFSKASPSQSSIRKDCLMEENDIKVWGLIHPDRKTLENLFKRALRSGVLRRVLGLGHRLYLKALLMAGWSEIRSLVVLKILAPIVNRISEALDGMHARCPSIMLPKSVIIKRGLERAESLLEKLRRAGAVKWAPDAIRWISSRAYRMWLGVTCAL